MKKLNENQMKLVMTVLMTLYTVNCFFPVQTAVLYFYLSKQQWHGQVLPQQRDSGILLM